MLVWLCGTRAELMRMPMRRAQRLGPLCEPGPFGATSLTLMVKGVLPARQPCRGEGAPVPVVPALVTPPSSAWIM